MVEEVNELNELRGFLGVGEKIGPRGRSSEEEVGDESQYTPRPVEYILIPRIIECILILPQPLLSLPHQMPHVRHRDFPLPFDLASPPAIIQLAGYDQLRDSIQKWLFVWSLEYSARRPEFTCCHLVPYSEMRWIEEVVDARSFEYESVGSERFEYFLHRLALVKADGGYDSISYRFRIVARRRFRAGGFPLS